VLTYRGGEVTGALADLLSALDRARLAGEMTLAPLRRSDVDAMVRAIFALNEPVRPDFTAALVNLTEGNPFCVEEVLKSLVAAGEIFYAGGTVAKDISSRDLAAEPLARARDQRRAIGERLQALHRVEQHLPRHLRETWVMEVTLGPEATTDTMRTMLALQCRSTTLQGLVSPEGTRLTVQVELTRDLDIETLASKLYATGARSVSWRLREGPATEPGA